MIIAKKHLHSDNLFFQFSENVNKKESNEKILKSSFEEN